MAFAFSQDLQMLLPIVTCKHTRLVMIINDGFISRVPDKDGIFYEGSKNDVQDDGLIILQRSHQK